MDNMTDITVRNELLIDSKQLEHRLGDETTLIVFVGSEAAFNAGHIPNSVHISPSELTCGIPPAVGKLPSIDKLTTLFRRIGLTEDSQLIAYDDEGGGWAGRLIWTLDVIGHAHYQYLDGGLHRWQAEKRPLEDSSDSSWPAHSDYQVTVQSELLVTAECIINGLSTEQIHIWDARSAQEHHGEKVLADRGGCIPGAANIDWLELIDHNRALQLKPLPLIKQMMDEAGLDGSKKIITHCQTHHRSGLSYLVGKLLGMPIAAYDGSWSEWGNRSDTPIENKTLTTL